MLEFTQDIRAAAEIYNQHGYKLCAWPKQFGKGVQKSGIPNWWTYDFPIDKITDKLNIGVNHFLTNTCAIDIDRLSMAEKVFDYIGINLNQLVESTMVWRSRPDSLKLIFKSPNIKLPWAVLRNKNNNTIFELRGAILSKQTEYCEFGYMDVLPPSIHPYTQQPYEFVTGLKLVADLPELPKSLLDVWNDWDNQYDKLYNINYRDQPF